MWAKINSDLLTDYYIKSKLRRDGIPPDQIDYDLIEIERPFIKTKRKLKNQSLC